MNASGFRSDDKDRETPIGSTHESEDPSFCTQEGLESIDLDSGGGSATQKQSKARERYSLEEDKLLIQSFLNISKDPVVGVDQKAASFWRRVTESYNEYIGKDMGTRTLNQLKARWHRLNSAVSKFVGCYKQAIESKTSGSSEHDVICNAKTIFRQDNGKKFTLEHAWHILKDEMKWQGGLEEGSSKRTKNSASGAYTSSSNPSTPTSGDGNPAMAFLQRPIGQKAAKRKGKEKKGEASSTGVSNLVKMKEAIDAKVGALSEFTRVFKDSEDERKDLMKRRLEHDEDKLRLDEIAILFKDTSTMTPIQLRAHEMLCNIIQSKHGIE